MENGRTLAELRLALVEARAAVRHAELGYQSAKALAEQSIIDQAGGEREIGANADARLRTLTLRLGDDKDFCEAEHRLSEERASLELLMAQAANAEDERRERERLTREKLADALLLGSPGGNLNALIDERVALRVAETLADIRTRGDLSAFWQHASRHAAHAPMVVDPDEAAARRLIDYGK